MKNKNKFAFGGYVDPKIEYLNIQKQRASNIPNQIENPEQAIADNNLRLNKAQQKAMSNPFTQGLDIFGNLAMQVGSTMMSKGISAGEGEDGKGLTGFLSNNQNFINTLLGGLNAGASFATGGIAENKKINAEGGEVVEMPGSSPKELQGPSHSQGGIDMQVPSGTEIYSDRLIGTDGKTMADRKKLREKQISKIEKLLQKNPNDPALKKTLEKIKQNNDFLDKQDLSQMQFVKDLVDHTNKFAFGGIADTDEDELIPLKSKPMEVILPDRSFSITPEMDARIRNSSAPQLGTTTSTQQKGFSLDNYLGETTLGDMIGMGANLFGPMAQMKNTVANRNATPLEQNAFKNYGDQALKKIQSQYGLLDDVRDNQLQDAERNRQGTIARNNNSARGINTQRALNLATDSSMNELKAGIYNQYASNVMGITKEEATQMAQNDQMKMTGEDRRAERELQNTDNFFNNMAKNISDKYRGIGETGKALNETKQRKTTNEILKDMNPNYEYDPYTGKLITKKTETLETEKAKDADIRRQGAVKSTSLENVYTKDGKLNPNKITQVRGNKHLSTKNYTSTDNTNLQSVMKKLNIDTLDLDNQDSIRTLQKALGMKSSDIAAGKFGQKTLLAIKKYLENNK